MCNLYSITTNQTAIIALFRKINRYVGNLAPMSGVVLSRLPATLSVAIPSTLIHATTREGRSPSATLSKGWPRSRRARKVAMAPGETAGRGAVSPLH